MLVRPSLRLPPRLPRLFAAMFVITFVGSWLTLWPITYGLGATHKLSARTGVLTGHVLIGPLTPVQKADEPPAAVPAAMFTSRFVVVRRVADGPVVVKARLRADGSYRVRLLPGTYLVDIEPGGFEKGKGPQSVTITRGGQASADFDIDTGIR